MRIVISFKSRGQVRRPMHRSPWSPRPSHYHTSPTTPSSHLAGTHQKRWASGWPADSLHAWHPKSAACLDETGKQCGRSKLYLPTLLKKKKKAARRWLVQLFVSRIRQIEPSLLSHTQDGSARVFLKDFALGFALVSAVLTKLISPRNSTQPSSTLHPLRFVRPSANRRKNKARSSPRPTYYRRAGTACSRHKPLVATHKGSQP